MVNKSERTVREPGDQIKIDRHVALVKDLVTSDVGDSPIHFCAISSDIATSKNKAPVAGIPVVSVKIGDRNYYGYAIWDPVLVLFPFHSIKKS